MCPRLCLVRRGSWHQLTVVKPTLSIPGERARHISSWPGIASHLKAPNAAASESKVRQWKHNGPLSGTPNARPGECLLVIAGDTHLPLFQLDQLIHMIRVGSASVLHLWVVVTSSPEHAHGSPPWTSEGPAVEDYQHHLVALRAKAQDQGFPARMLGPGRCCNMYVLTTDTCSESFLYAAQKTCGGAVVLLMEDRAKQAGQLRSWGGPVLLVHPWKSPLAPSSCPLVPYLVDSLRSAKCLGLRWCAKYRPVVAGGLEGQGIDHQPKERVQEGGPSPPGGPISLAPAIVYFLAAHQGKNPLIREVASEVMEKLLMETVQLMSPCTGAEARFPRLMDLVVAGQAVDLGEVGDVHVLHDKGNYPVATGLTGGDVVVRPYQLASRSFAERVQWQVIQALPEEYQRKLQVAVTVHDNMTQFSHQVPSLHLLPGGQVLVHSHILPVSASQGQVSGGQSNPGTAPEYWVKLKGANRIAQALGDPRWHQYSSITAQQVNAITLQQVLSSQQARGTCDFMPGPITKLICAEDWPMSTPGGALPDEDMMMSESLIHFKGSTEVLVSSPVLYTPVDATAGPSAPSRPQLLPSGGGARDPSLWTVTESLLGQVTRVLMGAPALEGVTQHPLSGTVPAEDQTGQERGVIINTIQQQAATEAVLDMLGARGMALSREALRCFMVPQDHHQVANWFGNVTMRVMSPGQVRHLLQ